MSRVLLFNLVIIITVIVAATGFTRLGNQSASYDYFFQRAIICQMLGDEHRAISCIEQALKRKETVEGWIILSDLLMRQGLEYKRALGCMERAIDLYGHETPALVYLRGQVRFYAEDFSGAQKDFERAMVLTERWATNNCLEPTVTVEAITNAKVAVYSLLQVE